LKGLLTKGRGNFVKGEVGGRKGMRGAFAGGCSEGEEKVSGKEGKQGPQAPRRRIGDRGRRGNTQFPTWGGRKMEGDWKGHCGLEMLK